MNIDQHAGSENPVHDPSSSDPCNTCTSRRGFLAATGAAASAMLLGQVFPDRVHADDADRPVRLAVFPRIKVATLAALRNDEPRDITYPPGVAMNEATLYKLGTPAGGGVGPDSDIVAFSSYCTHMGGDLRGEYNAAHKVAGPCPAHLTTFDLTRHGMVVAGHAVQSLPQIVLEVEGDDVYATGVVGLLYGHHALEPHAPV